MYTPEEVIEIEEIVGEMLEEPTEEALEKNRKSSELLHKARYE